MQDLQQAVAGRCMLPNAVTFSASHSTNAQRCSPATATSIPQLLIAQLDEDLCAMEEGLYSRAQQAVQVAERASLAELRGEMLRDAGGSWDVSCSSLFFSLSGSLTRHFWIQARRNGFWRMHVRLSLRSLSHRQSGRRLCFVVKDDNSLDIFVCLGSDVKCWRKAAWEWTNQGHFPAE